MEKKTTTKKRTVKKPAKEKEVKAPEQEVVLAPLAVEAEADQFPEEVFDEKKGGKKFFEAVGRRKSSIARVRLFTIKPFEGEEGKITVNDKSYKDYFHTMELQQIAEASLKKLKSLNRFEVVARVKGGGIHSQAEAVRHGLARTLVLFNADFRKKLKKAGYMKRDPRVKERRKYGLKKARKSPQWAKR